MLKNYTKVDYSTLKYSLENKMFKPFVLYTQVKAKFYHSIIFNYTPNKLAKLTGLHQKTVKRYIRKLENHNLVELHCGNLLFKQPFYEKPTKFLYIKTNNWDPFFIIKENLELLVLQSNAKMQAFNILGHYGKNIGILSRSVRKKAIRKASKTKLPDYKPLERNDEILFTCSGIAKLFNYSNMSASNMLRRLKQRRRIKIKRVIKEIKDSLFDLNYYGYTFLMNNKLFLDKGVSIKIL